MKEGQIGVVTKNKTPDHPLKCRTPRGLGAVRGGKSMNFGVKADLASLLSSVLLSCVLLGQLLTPEMDQPPASHGAVRMKQSRCRTLSLTQDSAAMFVSQACLSPGNLPVSLPHK